MEQLQKQNNNIKIGVKIGLSLLFILCLIDMPYGYYQLVRFFGLTGFAWLAYMDSNRNDKSLMIIWIVSALLINPFLKLALGRTIWNIIDVLFAILLILTILLDYKAMRKLY